MTRAYQNKCQKRTRINSITHQNCIIRKALSDLDHYHFNPVKSGQVFKLARIGIKGEKSLVLSYPLAPSPPRFAGRWESFILISRGFVRERVLVCKIDARKRRREGYLSPRIDHSELPPNLPLRVRQLVSKVNELSRPRCRSRFNSSINASRAPPLRLLIESLRRNERPRNARFISCPT